MFGNKEGIERELTFYLVKEEHPPAKPQKTVICYKNKMQCYQRGGGRYSEPLALELRVRKAGPWPGQVGALTGRGRCLGSDFGCVRSALFGCGAAYLYFWAPMMGRRNRKLCVERKGVLMA